MPLPNQNDDDRRLEALRRYHILDTPPEREFDDVTRLVAYICKAPIALISLVDAERQWFKSALGIGVSQTPIGSSICGHAIRQQDLFVVGDTLTDPRFRDNPLVTGDPGLRFYAGAPLHSADGMALGTLCVLDYVPRELTAEQQDALRILARQVMGQLELRRHLRAQAQVISQQESIRDALTEANRVKDQFLAALSHELRTPLAPVLLLAQSLETDHTLPASARQDMGAIRQNIELEARLIDDLLDLTRVAHGKLQLVRRPLDAHALIRQAHDTCCAAEERHTRVNLRVELTAASHWVDADGARLQQVIWNLLKNAIKFTPDGGDVTLRTENGPGGELIVSVADAGVGIDPAILSKIFDAFEQGDRAVTRQFGGLGLGLAICKAVVDLHGGRIDAWSEGKDRGATFSVTLATVPPRVPAAPLSGAAPQGAAARALRILLVEDHASTAMIMARLLGRFGHDVRTANCVRSAVELAAEHSGRFDLLISDLGLPDGTGHMLMEELRAKYAIPGIALSGYGMEEDIRQSRDAGFAAHLVKPVDIRHLQAAIERVAAGG